MNILQAIDDPRVFGEHFRDAESWRAWRAFLAVLFGLPVPPAGKRLFRASTGRSAVPETPSHEAWLVIGRRGGKSFILALIAVYLASFRDWRPYLGPGERATVMVIAADRRQARVTLRYVKGLISSTPMLAQTVENETAESIDLTSRVTIEVHSASYRSVRGYSCCAVICDEVAVWRSEESANPDVEIIAALRPTLATIPGAMLLCASSPYARRGALWNAYRKHYGSDGNRVLVWQAPTRTMNPTVPQSVVDEAMADDPAHASAEYMAEFRSDVESYIAREAVEAVVSRGVRERAPVAGVGYFAFVDPSGGSNDSFTLAVAHREGGTAIVDCIRETKPPFSPESVVAEYATLLKSYRVCRVQGDRYAGEWPREAFRRHGVAYFPAAKAKSDLYRDLLPAINSGRVDLLDSERLVAQLVSLERRTARGGRDSIDHPPGGRDDLGNCAAGVVDLLLSADTRRPRAALFGPQVFQAGRRIHGRPAFEVGGPVPASPGAGKPAGPDRVDRSGDRELDPPRFRVGAGAVM